MSAVPFPGHFLPEQSPPLPRRSVIRRNLHLPFWLLTFAYGGAFILPTLLAEGTFFDGEIYAVLARNYADGLGELWKPHLSVSTWPVWFEHPPLGLWLMSLSYRLLGDHMWVEHFHSFLTAVAGGLMIVAIWRRMLRDHGDLVRFAWLPLVMWLLNPQVTWAYSNAMLENTSSIFVLVAVYCFIRANESGASVWSWTIGAGMPIVAAVLTKGPVGLFPLVCAPLAALILGRPPWSKAALMALVMTVIVAGAFGLLWLWPAARHDFQKYLDLQLLASLAGRRGGSPGLGQLSVKLLNTHLPALGLMILLGGVAYWRRRAQAFVASPARLGLWFLALGLAGSLPLGLSPRQSLFYCLPSFPLTALGIAMLTVTPVRALMSSMQPGERPHRIWSSVGVTLFVAVLVFSATRIDTYGRNVEVRRDVKVIVEYVSQGLDENEIRGTILALCPDMRQHWTLHTCINRYGKMGVDNTGVPHPYMVGFAACADSQFADYEKVPLETAVYFLYRAPATDPEG